MIYKYITENNLEYKQNYMYSECGGGFLESYISSRKELTDFPVSEKGMHQSYEDLYQIRTLLKTGENRFPEYKQIVDAYVKTFEVRKRIYLSYDEKWKPIDNEYTDYEVYLLFANVLILVYEITHSYKYFNTLLKVDDTIISIYNFLNSRQKRVLSKILRKEIQFYYNSVNRETEVFD